jgi:hypothetical protein
MPVDHTPAGGRCTSAEHGDAAAPRVTPKCRIKSGIGPIASASASPNTNAVSMD